MFGPGMYGTNECIEAETDVRIDCKFCMFMIGTGYQGDYYGDSSTCSDQTAPPAVAFEDVVGPAYGNATDGYSLDSAKQIIINKVTNNGATTLADGWNTGTGDFSNYHYWKPALPDQNLADFNFFNTTLLSKKIMSIILKVASINLTSQAEISTSSMHFLKVPSPLLPKMISTLHP